ncbi:Multidrug resistance-associated protein 1 [Mortierella polycephala]|uniref:Multidrug resistance-associated protein 1 n=1 Tax=Mortierella polycephala TaxID=41804 RepID=A0A9P6QEF2_9FUNG|nr:Multidrug resistance-associated protein 1 [Mortierella polycephala]
MVWIDFLMAYGGYLTLMGIPALIATVSFIGRMRWLKRNRTPHPYGRTNLIYWPTQICIAIACSILLSFVASLTRASSSSSSSSGNGLLAGVVLSLLASIAALPLNKLEHRYEVRSSNYLFAYFACTIVTSAIALYILSDEEYRRHQSSRPSSYGLLFYFIISIGGALFFEALPRKNTKVQRLAREKENLSDFQLANLFSRLSYHYFQRIVSLGASRPLTGDDLVNTCPNNLLANTNYERIVEYWEKEKTKSATKNRQPSYLWSVMKAYKGQIAVMLSIRILGFGVLYIPPMLFGQLLRFIDDYSKAIREGVESPPLKIGFVLATCMMAFNIMSTVALAAAFQRNSDLGIKARGATIALIYRKSLKLSPQARQSCTLGEITNHMALLGWSLFAGLGVFVVLIPIQAKMASFVNGFQDKHLKWMDRRLRLMTEILSNIKIVKLYHWEKPFRQKIDVLRTKELRVLKDLATVQSILTIFFSSITLIMAFFTFWVYAYVGGPNMTPGKMTPDVVFVSITLFGIMGRPLGMVSHMISITISVNVAMKRIQKFLLMEEIDTTVVRRYSRQQPPPESGNNDIDLMAVEIEHGTFAWEKQEEVNTTSQTDVSSLKDERQPLLAAAPPKPVKPTLSNINLRVPDGHLTAIVGRIGQGKSSLLSAIMGEMYKQQGTITVYGDLAYVPQQAWIINATMRDNILFGKPFDKVKYDQIIHAAGLQPDLEMLTAGDQTEIGERGINLSGGQKQRVSLARAAYQDADVYLFDDPLSAVDAHVDQHLWNNLIGSKGLLKDKTRLLVTHGIHHLEHVDEIVVLKGGVISEMGEYQHLMNARGAFYQLVKEFSATRKKKSSSSSKNHLPDHLHGDIPSSSNSSVNYHSDSEGDTSGRNTVVEETGIKKDNNDGDGVKGENGELIAEEEMGVGKVGWKIALIYAKAASYRNVLFSVFLIVVAQACHIGTNFWLRYWIIDTDERNRDGRVSRPASYYLMGYGMVVVLYMMLDLVIHYVAQVICGIRASTILYDRLLTRVLRLPMSFFDTTPMGRIVNRFSSDIYSIDSQLPQEWADIFAFGSIIGGTLVVIAYSTPIFLVVVPPLAFMYFWIQDYFIRSSGSLKRLKSISQSPLYQHFSETLTGVSTIRVMKGFQDQFIHENEVRGDLITNRLNAYNLDNRWLQLRLESLGGVTVFISTALAVLNAGKLDPSLVGLALSYALNMIGLINYMVRTVSEVQNILVSVERVDEYSQTPTEAPEETGARLPQNWPSQGRIVFKNYSARYREGLDLVVKDVSFTVQPTEKVGIVGRTGAGKSSLTLALFRIIEAADSYWARASDPSVAEQKFDDMMAVYSDTNGSGGSVEIDGIDISTLGLKDLRQHLSIIPQDPTLFAGTVRENLDPFEEHSDKGLWEALERAHLKTHISSLAGGLSFEVAQNGDNFSVGQRSLICLARALLRKTKVLVLDEATAAVDVETDDLIQKTIRKEFKDRTILTIAHRIKTVMDSDKILVLEKGRVQEYEPPQVLLKRKDSLFYQLAEQAGEVDEHPQQQQHH